MSDDCQEKSNYMGIGEEFIALRPWDISSELASLLDMIRFYGERFLRVARVMADLSRICMEAEERYPQSPITQVPEWLERLDDIVADCEQMELRAPLAQIKRIKEKVLGIHYSALAEMLDELQNRLYDSLSSTLLMAIPRAALYEDAPQFGEAVAAKFPKSVTDIQEAAKCLATGRYTATVFHLMRVTEAAVQFLGRKLNINLVDERNWHNILDEVDKAIKRLPVTNARQKAIRNKYSEASAHLRMVKDAWRNDVMHPKETYTDEEAERVFRNVKDFMVHLALTGCDDIREIGKLGTVHSGTRESSPGRAVKLSMRGFGESHG